MYYIFDYGIICSRNTLRMLIPNLANSIPYYKGYKKLSSVSIHRRTCSSNSVISRTQPTLVKDALTRWVEQLKKDQIPEAELTAEYIISHVICIPRRKLTSQMNSLLSQEKMKEVERLMTCRLARMPLQYILGEWDFHDITLKLRPPVFIPRPETEHLVKLALDCLQGIETPRVLDIGCGSGAISLSLLHARKDIMCVAVDQSQNALKLTEENANDMGLQERLTLVEGKVTTNTPLSLPHNTYDLVVSNPPYVLRKDLMALQPEIMLYEDLRALDGGAEGMDVIKSIFYLSHTILPYNRCLLMEVDPCHPYLIPVWLEKQNELKMVVTGIYQDFCQKDRFIKCIKSE